MSLRLTCSTKTQTGKGKRRIKNKTKQANKTNSCHGKQTIVIIPCCYLVSVGTLLFSCYDHMSCVDSPGPVFSHRTGPSFTYFETGSYFLGLAGPELTL